jgi:ADP-ribose pyrophosphatase
VTQPGREQKLRRRTVYRGRILNLFVDQVRLPNRREYIREIVDHKPAVAVVPVLPDGRVVLVRQFRYAVGRMLWELPAGIIEPREKPLAAAVRELREETGYRARRFRLLGKIFTSPGFCRERIYLYLADGLQRAGTPRPDADELVLASALRLPQALTLIRRGRIQDGKTVLGLCWLAGELKSGRI